MYRVLYIKEENIIINDGQYDGIAKGFEVSLEQIKFKVILYCTMYIVQA